MHEEQPTPPDQTDHQPDAKPEEPMPKPAAKPFYKSRLFLLLFVLIALLLILGTAWFLKQRHDTDSKKTNTSAKQSTPAPKVQQQQLAPYDVVYSHETQGTNVNGCSQMQAHLLWKPLSGAPETNAADLGAQSIVSYHDIYKNKVIAVADAGCGSTAGTAVWYSTDAGRTYTKVFSGAQPSSDAWDQITSAKFSTDGSRIVIGFTAAGALNNVVKEIDPVTKASTDLFTVNSRGVFIQGYNRTTHQVLYYSGCYNCDGNTFSKLRAHDTNNNADTVLFDDPTHVTMQTSPNSDLSKLMLVKGVQGDMIGGIAPFTVEEFDVATKTTTTLQTVNQDALLHVGYRADGTRYYAKNTALYGFAANGTATILFTAAHSIQDVYYVGADEVVLATGENNAYDVIKSPLAAPNATTLLTADAHYIVFGIGWK